MKITKVTEDAVATLLDDLLKRSPNNYTGYADKVQAIIDDVRERGDEALFEMTKRFDGADLNADNIRVTQAEIDEAYTLVDASLIEVIRKAMTNICCTIFHISRYIRCLGKEHLDLQIFIHKNQFSCIGILHLIH